MDSLQELFVDELKDLYSAENQLLKALPKMAKGAVSPELKQGFEKHLKQTEGHVARLVKIFEKLDESPKGKKCAAMEGLIEEGKELLDEEEESVIRDAGLICAAQKVEHYEIASYGTAVAWARKLGDTQSEKLLQQTLDEEKATNETLTELAEEINEESLQTANTAEDSNE